MKRRVSCLLFAAVATFLFAASGQAALLIDQSNTVGGGSINLAYASPVGQEFTPTHSNLAAVSYLGGGSTYLNIREDTITGKILYTTGSVAPGTDGWSYFDIDPDLWLTTGKTYVLEIKGTGMVTRNSGLSDPYPNGGFYSWGGYSAKNDLVFRTYYDPNATAPVPIPGAAWLLGSGLMGLVGWTRSRRLERKA
jgi:hypothetical protein